MDVQYVKINTAHVQVSFARTTESPPMPFRNSLVLNLVKEHYIEVLFRTCCINKQVPKTPLRKTEL